MKPLLIDNTAEARFELKENNRLAFADYRRGPDRLIVTHVEVEPEARGTGLAGRLMEAICDYADDRHIKIEPRCPYAAGWMEMHPELAYLRVEPQVPQDGTLGQAFAPDLYR